MASSAYPTPSSILVTVDVVGPAWETRYEVEVGLYSGQILHATERSRRPRSLLRPPSASPWGHTPPGGARASTGGGATIAVVGLLAVGLLLLGRKVKKRQESAEAAGQPVGDFLEEAARALGGAVPPTQRVPVSTLNVSPRGLQELKDSEGLRLTLYLDVASHATIGVGHLVHKGPIDGTEPAAFKDGITEQEALDLLQADVQRFVAALRRLVTVPVSQNEFDALLNLVFNIGVGNFTTSTLLRKLNAGDYAGAAAQFPAWRLAGGKVSPGLVARRARERTLFEETVA